MNRDDCLQAIVASPQHHHDSFTMTATNDLTQKRCVPCEGQVDPATALDIARMQQQIPKWELIEVEGVQRIQRVFTFPTFLAAMHFAQGVADLAEADGHHPALLVEWGKTTVTWWTHAISGLHENDFIMAAKTDALVRERQVG